MEERAEIPIPAHVAPVAGFCGKVIFCHGEDIAQYVGKLHTRPYVTKPVNEHDTISAQTRIAYLRRILEVLDNVLHRRYGIDDSVFFLLLEFNDALKRLDHHLSGQADPFAA